MDDETRRARGGAFEAVADVYERSRPTYPDAAVGWLVGDTPTRVLELGAGTGKLTGSLVARRHQVVATEPSESMLAQLCRRHPGAHSMSARAENLPFRSQSFDAVVVAQAYHWFDPVPSLPEISRVLRPQGTFALVWNMRDERVPWVRRLGLVIGSQDRADMVDEDLATIETSGLFAPLERESFRFWQQLDRDGLRGLVESRSHVALLGADERGQVMAGVEALYDEYGRGHDGMRLPYVTHCFRTHRTAPAPRAEPPQESPDADGDLLFDFR